MHISALEEYGLRCALQLAKGAGRGPLSASQIAESEGISVEYVSKFMHLFKKTGFVTAARGVQGGFSLVRSPNEITLKEVFDALKAKKTANSNFCNQYAGQQQSCVHIHQCSVRPFWQLLSFYFDEVTHELTLTDLLEHENMTRDKIKALVGERIQAVKKAVASSRRSESVLEPFVEKR